MNITAAAIATLLLTGSAALADEVPVYKWVDDAGIPHYTDRPPNDANVSLTNIRSQRTNPDAVLARVEKQAEQDAAAAEARAKADEATAQAAAEQQKALQERQANCERARQRAETYATAHRLYRPLPDGGREYLTDSELTAARMDAEAAVSTWCD